jgi:hypothetical protein
MRPRTAGADVLPARGGPKVDRDELKGDPGFVAASPPLVSHMFVPSMLGL